jgi:hypothetical protein
MRCACERAGVGARGEGAVDRQARVDRRAGCGRGDRSRGERGEERDLEPEGHVAAAM